jgi:hypothetical protein
VLSRGVLALLLTGACYRPSAEPACSVRCDHNAGEPPCPGELTCGADNFCSDGTRCGTDGGSTIDADGCPGLGWLHYCPPAMLADLLLNGPPIDTNAGCTATIPSPAGDLCVIAAENITVTALTRITGGKPLVLVARDTIQIFPVGGLDISSGGAGSMPTGCGRGADGIEGTVAGESVGGGAGGSFASSGGDGGAIAQGGAATPAQPGLMPAHLRGGCDGGQGGTIAAGVPGTSGRGGGAIYLMAHTLDIRGSIIAWGQPGGGGRGASALPGGGGGGGSGGHIVLDGTTILFASTAVLLANGGGGGAGGSNGLMGADGVETQPAMPGVAARGGNPPGTVNCGMGGDGSLGPDGGRDGFPAMGTSGAGGGGGGGAGQIKVFSGGTFAPAGSIFPPPT